MEHIENKILLVDDVETWHTFLRRALRERAPHILLDSAENGEEAVQKIRKSTDYLAIVMDMEMPVMGGCEATKKIRSLLYDRPIIGFSSRGGVAFSERGLEAGMDAYIVKDAGFKKLLNLMEDLGVF